MKKSNSILFIIVICILGYIMFYKIYLNEGSVVNNEIESLKERQEFLEKQYDEQIKNITLQSPSDAEIVDMRIAADGELFKTAGERLNVLEEELNLKATTVNLEKFITNTTDNTQDLKNALAYCKANNKSLYVPDGTYYLSSPIVLDSENFSLIGESRNVIFYISHNDYAFTINEHRIRISNIKIKPLNDKYKYKYNGIHCKKSQSLIKNVQIDHVNEAIKFSTDSWCSNATELNVSYCNKGIIFGEGSGGNYVQFEVINGSAGYENTTANGSVGITFEKNTGHHIIGDGGQLSSFQYAFDFNGGLNFRPSKIGKIYVEHNLSEFTPNSSGLLSEQDSHIVQDYDSNNSDVIKFTQNGVNKATYFNNAKDSAIPVNNILAYFDFNRTSPFTDKSKNGAYFNNTTNYTLVDDSNLFGKSVSILAKNDGNSGNITIPNLGSKFSIVISYRQTTNDIGSNNLRMFELNNNTPGTNGADLMFVPDTANNLTMYDREIKKSKTLINLGASYKYGYNNCVGFTFDLDEGILNGYTPNNYSVTVQDDLIKTLKDNFNLNFMKAWSDTEPEVFNYLAVFDGILEYDEFLNIYREVKPLLN